MVGANSHTLRLLPENMALLRSSARYRACYISYSFACLGIRRTIPPWVTGMKALILLISRAHPAGSAYHPPIGIRSLIGRCILLPSFGSCNLHLLCTLRCYITTVVLEISQSSPFDLSLLWRHFDIGGQSSLLLFPLIKIFPRDLQFVHALLLFCKQSYREAPGEISTLSCQYISASKGFGIGYIKAWGFSLTRTHHISTSHPHLNSSLILKLYLTSLPLFRPTHHLLYTSFPPAKCANTQGTTISTLHVLTLELTTSLPPSMAAKTDNALRVLMNDILSFPDIVPCAHEYQPHHGTSTSHQEFQHITFDSTIAISTFTSQLIFSQYPWPLQHTAGFWTIFSGKINRRIVVALSANRCISFLGELFLSGVFWKWEMGWNGFHFGF